MRTSAIKAVFQVVTIAVFVCLTLTGIAMAGSACAPSCEPVCSPATTSGIGDIPSQLVSGVGNFFYQALTTPAGSPAGYHDLKASKPVVKTLWRAPHPTLSEERMR